MSKEQNILRATYNGDLPIGDMVLRCHVLEDARRLLSGRSVTNAMGLRGRGQGMTRFLTSKSLKPFVNKKLVVAIENPVIFRGSVGNRLTHGYEAWVLPELCNVVIDAHDQGLLRPHQNVMAKQAKILTRAFSTVGIIALVDEATGYQEVRDRLALQEILDKYLRDFRGIWAKTFPDEFYKHLFRLKGWQFRPLDVKRPGVVGHWTNDVVYARLAPGILKELRKRNPTIKPGRRRGRHHQWFTEDIGHPHLREHISNVIFLMEASSGWQQFYRGLQRAAPKYGDTLELPLEEN